MPETPSKRRAPAKTQQQAMVEGRKQAAAVRSYLEALKAARAPKRRGRKRTPETIQSRLASLQEELHSDLIDPLRELKLIQEQSDLQAELESLQTSTLRPEDYEDGFIAVAKSYGERQGIQPDTWKILGVPRDVLKRANLQ